MDKFEQILSENSNINVTVESLPAGLSGLTLGEDRIIINKSLSDEEKLQTLCEEIGHIETSAGDISDYSQKESKKQERLTRNRGIKKLVPLEIIKKYKSSAIDGDFEVAEELGIQVSYLHEAGEIYHII